MIRTRQRDTLLAAFIVVVMASAIWPTASLARDNWVSLVPQSSSEEVCLTISGRDFTYYLLDAQTPVDLAVRGPRRIKIITRQILAADGPAAGNYGVRVFLDGQRILERQFSSDIHGEVSLCGAPDGAVCELRRNTVSIGSGQHQLQVFCDGDNVAARFFRETKRKRTRTAPYAPERFDAVRTMQFASGTQSTYYAFDEIHPLEFSVVGPTTLKIHTRLDFDHTMNGSQTYGIEILRDGVPWREFHYHTSKMSSALYLERDDILPGARKTLHLPVPRGRHDFQVRCIRPGGCFIAAQIRIPTADLDGK